ncbi:MAG: hypothetical protein MUF42_13005 [Cytophagaceae bacterium]|nr:hypothetical protein [Cytophagaceae bacterium]
MRNYTVLMMFFFFWGELPLCGQQTQFTFYNMLCKGSFRNKIFKSERYQGAQFELIPSFTWASGFLFSNVLHKNLRLTYGFHILQDRCRYRLYIHSIGEYYQGAIRLMYGRFPVMLQYSFLRRSGLELFTGAGIQPALLLRERGAYPLWDNGGTGTFDVVGFDPAPVTGAYRLLGLEATAMLGWQLRIFKKVYYHQALRWSNSFWDIENKKMRNVQRVESKEFLGDELGYFFYESNRGPTLLRSIGLGLIGLTFELN